MLTKCSLSHSVNKMSPTDSPQGRNEVAPGTLASAYGSELLLPERPEPPGLRGQGQSRDETSAQGNGCSGLRPPGLQGRKEAPRAKEASRDFLGSQGTTSTERFIKFTWQRIFFACVPEALKFQGDQNARHDSGTAFRIWEDRAGRGCKEGLG